MKHLATLGGLCICVNILSAHARVEAQTRTRGDAYVSNSSAAAQLRANSSFTVQPSTTLDPDPLPSLAPQLALDGTMRFYPASSSQLDVVQIDLTNHGALPATEPYVAVELLSYPFDGTLYQYWGGTATAEYTLNGGERGFVRIEVWHGTLQECRTYEVTVRMPAQDVALTGSIATQCPLRWTTPIDAMRLGATPDPLVLGKTLEDIVSSRVQGSAKGLCSNCHNRDAGVTPYYKPNVPRGSTNLIEPFDPIGNHIGSPNGKATWAFGGTDPNGNHYYSWAEWFISRDDKPEGLKQVFKKWMSDGALR